MKTNARALFFMAVERWGERSQIIMALEELAECSTRLAQELRGRNDAKKTAEEIADAQIMLDQMEFIFPGVAEWREKKLRRLSALLADPMNEDGGGE